MVELSITWSALWTIRPLAVISGNHGYHFQGDEKSVLCLHCASVCVFTVQTCIHCASVSSSLCKCVLFTVQVCPLHCAGVSSLLCRVPSSLYRCIFTVRVCLSSLWHTSVTLATLSCQVIEPESDWKYSLDLKTSLGKIQGIKEHFKQWQRRDQQNPDCGSSYITILNIETSGKGWEASGWGETMTVKMEPTLPISVSAVTHWTVSQNQIIRRPW